MTNKTVTVKLPNDADARPVAILVQIASKFESRIFIVDNNKKINAKSIMGMMTLNVESGEEISVSADGEDEDAALNSIEKYLCCVQ